MSGFKGGPNAPQCGSVSAVSHSGSFPSLSLESGVLVSDLEEVSVDAVEAAPLVLAGSYVEGGGPFGCVRQNAHHERFVRHQRSIVPGL